MPTQKSYTRLRDQLFSLGILIANLVILIILPFNPGQIVNVILISIFAGFIIALEFGRKPHEVTICSSIASVFKNIDLDDIDIGDSSDD